MEDIIEERVITGIIDYQDEKNEKSGVPPPPAPTVSVNSTFLWHCCFFLLGICHFLPLSFCTASNNFWLHKFRNTSDPTESAGNRTVLQVNFSSVQMICSSVVSLLVAFFNIAVAYKIRIMTRIYVTLILELMVFVLLTISIKMDTDNVQVEYFCFVLLSFCVLNAANGVNILATANLYPRFPHAYMHTCLAGEGVAGIVGDLLNIASIRIYNNDLTKGTMMYFAIGCGTIIMSIVLITVAARSNSFKDALASVHEDVTRKRYTIRQQWNMLCKIRYPAVTALYFGFTMVMSHPTVTSLVVSEDHDKQTVWASTYFSPVMTFLLSDICSFLGRIATVFIKTDIPEKIFYVFGLLRFVTLIPFLWLCNVQPRNYIPVVFSHDYQYGIILGVFCFTNGIIINWGMLLLPKLVTKQEMDGAYTVFGVFMSVTGLLMSPISLFIVNLL
ncbi:equilibrative nucleoside transporter 3-like [Euwallacea similis]|uniref:equilibrative nucleoside transporter 3-like n=1 Tax=Euwallacea similis TaxID=1736056 RepID=UPI00344BF7AD